MEALELASLSTGVVPSTDKASAAAGGFFDPDRYEEVECLPCVDSPVQVELVHSASSSSVRHGDQQSAKASGPEGILHFSASPY